MIIEPEKEFDQSLIYNYTDYVMRLEKYCDELMNFILFDKLNSKEDIHNLLIELDKSQKHLNNIKNAKF